MDTVLIMAAGTHDRWPGQIKQLLPIGDATIIGRIVQQCKARDVRPIVFTHEPDIRAAVHCFKDVPRDRSTLLHSITGTTEYWDGVVHVLLGDVVYTDQAIDAIFTPVRYPAFFGNKREVYALVFDDLFRMDNHIHDTISAGGKTLWHLYYYMTGNWPARKHVYKNEWPMIEITDETDDVDTPQGYADLLKRWPQGVK